MPEKTIGDQHAATSAVMTKIQQAMELFGDSHVGNLILREGTKLEYETSMSGRVAFVDFDAIDTDANTSETSGSVCDPLTRDEMHALFDVVDK